MTTPMSTPLLREPHNRIADKAVLYWRLRALLFWLGLLVVETAGLLFAPDHLTPAIRLVIPVTAVVGVVHTLVMPPWRRRVHRWEIRPESMYVQSGWWVQERRIAPVSRIQTVDQKRGPIEQWLGLASVTVTTASAAGAIVIRGLGSEVAEQIVTDLNASAQLATDDAT